MRVLLKHRAWVTGIVAGVVGFVARTLVPWRADDPILVLIATYRPAPYHR